MNPDARTIWQAPSWALAILLACLGMLGPFSIDTYLPAFTGIAKAIGASPVEMQQTLSAYLFGFAIMNLFHGALSDSFGRRPVVLWGVAVFTLASAGCALSQTIGQLVFFRLLQGLSTGAGIVVSRAARHAEDCAEETIDESQSRLADHAAQWPCNKRAREQRDEQDSTLHSRDVQFDHVPLLSTSAHATAPPSEMPRVARLRALEPSSIRTIVSRRDTSVIRSSPKKMRPKPGTVTRCWSMVAPGYGFAVHFIDLTMVA